MRLACLYVPDFPLAALLRAHPDLRGEAVVVADSMSPKAKVVAVSPAATRRGVGVGLSVAQAMAMDATLLVRFPTADILRAAQAALCDAAESFSPRVEDAEGGIAYLDLEGLGSLFESESQLAQAIARRAAHLGVDACVGVAGSKMAAYLAAHHGLGVAVIPAGEEWGHLAAVPVSMLQPSRNLAATLQRWGIRTLGDLAALPVAAIATRLGSEGVSLVRRARGEDSQPLVSRPLLLCFEESVELDYGIDAVEPLLFVLRGLLDRLLARLAVRGFVCGDLRLSLVLANRDRDERTVAVAVPSQEAKVLLSLVRLHLEAHPPHAAVTGIRMTALPEHLRAVQLDLFRPHGPAPAQLAVTLARLAAICGADRVGMPVVADSHRPDAYGVASFGLPLDLDNRSGKASPEILEHRAGQGRNITPVVALRALRPPHAVEVFCTRDHPEFVRGKDFAGRVVQAAGPWRLCGEWWSETRFARDYYDAQLSDGGVYRLYWDTAAQQWFVDGIYD